MVRVGMGRESNRLLQFGLVAIMDWLGLESVSEFWTWERFDIMVGVTV
jgi:hypothetical protein